MLKIKKYIVNAKIFRTVRKKERERERHRPKIIILREGDKWSWLKLKVSAFHVTLLSI